MSAAPLPLIIAAALGIAAVLPRSAAANPAVTTPAPATIATAPLPANVVQPSHSASITAPTPATLATLAFAITGPGWTVPRRLHLLMDSRIGDTFEAATFWRDVSRIRNHHHDVFLSVTANVVTDTTGGVHARIDIVDRWSLIPLFEPTFGGEVLRVVVGIQDGNLLGRNHAVAAVAGIHRSPGVESYIVGAQWLDRQFWGRHELFAQVMRDFGVDSYFLGDTLISRYAVTIVRGQLQAIYRRWDELRPGAYLVFDDRRFSYVTGITAVPDGRGGTAIPERTTSLQPGLTLTLGRIDFERFQYQGWDLVAAGFVQTRLSGPRGYVGGSIQVRGFWRPYPRLNLALRTRLTAQNSRHPSDAVAYGGFAHVRGYPSDFARGTLTALTNAELRAIVFPDLWNTFWIQAVAFADAAVLAYGSLTALGPTRRMHSLGVGLRGTILQIWGTFVRIDIGLPVDPNYRGWGLSFSVKQFF